MKKCEGFVRAESDRRETFFTLFRQIFPVREKTPSVSVWLFIRQAHFVPIFLHKKLKNTVHSENGAPGLKCIVHVFARFPCRLIEAVGFESGDKRLIVPCRRAVSRRLKIPQAEFSRPKPFSANIPAGKPPLRFARPLVKISVSHRFKRVRLKHHLPDGAQAFKIRTIRPHPIDSYIADQKHSLLSFAFRFRPEQPCH